MKSNEKVAGKGRRISEGGGRRRRRNIEEEEEGGERGVVTGLGGEENES